MSSVLGDEDVGRYVKGGSFSDLNLMKKEVFTEVVGLKKGVHYVLDLEAKLEEVLDDKI